MATHSVLTVELDGANVAVEVVRRPTSRRLSLRVDTALGRPRVSAPTGVAAADIATFLVRNKGWLRQRLAKLPTPVPFVEGAKIPLRGVLHRLRHCPGRRGTAWVAPGPTAEAPLDLCVTGGSAHLARRVGDFLRAEARADLSQRARHHAAALDVKITGLTLRDPRSRWGSCAANSRLSFSWRRVLAPPAVLDYVAAHEVAHLVEHNHSPRFWRLTDDLCPGRAAAQAWLKRHGGELHRYGRGD